MMDFDWRVLRIESDFDRHLGHGAKVAKPQHLHRVRA